MQNIILGPGILCQNLCSPRRPPPWFTKHHLRCFTINNASSGDKLELEEAQVSDLEFNLPISMFRLCYFTVQISLARSKETASKATSSVPAATQGGVAAPCCLHQHLPFTCSLLLHAPSSILKGNFTVDTSKLKLRVGNLEGKTWRCLF
uniref:Uncharacterized protein n=1 Tax=Cairina moschata TaxID=8855 RepID=A0A8C3BJK7_CAIMO